MRCLSKTLLLGLMLAAAWTAAAERGERHPLRGFEASDRQLLMIVQQDGPSLSEAVEMVRRQYRGRIVSAETHRRGNREVHVIKVLTEDGKVKTVQIPGRSAG